MTTRFRLPLIALAAALAVPAQGQSASDFSLEPAPTPTATPQVQGPVDSESGVVPVRPRVIATATPTPSPTPTVQPTVPAATAPPILREPSPRPRATVASPIPSAPPRGQTAPVDPTAIESTQSPPAIDEAPPATATSTPVPTAPVPAESTAEESASESLPWLWIGGALALFAALAGAFVAWRRRRNAIVPEIERPAVAASDPPASVPLSEALMVRFEGEKLIRSAAFATLKYRLTVINRTQAALKDVQVGVDLVSAHSGAPMEQQIATTATALDKRHDLARIAPSQSLSLEGQVQLPLAQAQVIRQGRHPLLVPLLRVRVDGPGEGALVKTFVVGQGQPGGGRVQPFRLDEPPRSYAPIAQRELA